jgi:hypothetical protein
MLLFTEVVQEGVCYFLSRMALSKEAKAGGSWLSYGEVVLGVTEMGLEINPSLLGGWFCIPGSDVGDKAAGVLENDLSNVNVLLTSGRGLCGLQHEGVVIYFCPQLVDQLFGIVLEGGKIGLFGIQNLWGDLAVLAVKLVEGIFLLTAPVSRLVIWLSHCRSYVDRNNFVQRFDFVKVVN